MMTNAVVLLAAGSLKGAFIPLLARFHQQTGILVEAHFGPAGLLREQIEGGAGNVVRKRHLAAELVGDGTVGKGITGKQANRQALTSVSPGKQRGRFDMRRLG